MEKGNHNPSGHGDCINLTLIEAPRFATWDLSGIAVGSVFAGEAESTFVAVSETGATTDTVSEASVAGFQATVNSRKVQTYTILDDPLGYLEIVIQVSKTLIKTKLIRLQKLRTFDEVRVWGFM